MFCLPVPTRQDRSAYSCCREICGRIQGIYKSLTDTWMWKLGLRPRNSQKRNTRLGFSLQCIQSRQYTTGCEENESFIKIFTFQIHFSLAEWFLQKCRYGKGYFHFLVDWRQQISFTVSTYTVYDKFKSSDSSTHKVLIWNGEWNSQTITICDKQRSCAIVNFPYINETNSGVALVNSLLWGLTCQHFFKIYSAFCQTLQNTSLIPKKTENSSRELRMFNGPVFICILSIALTIPAYEHTL